ncbi:ESPR-type extended signal peptide-containing protein, partial [Burkholderia stabilis]|uniref:ESPR-type extended signal peptide-containing protein n=1 Tax=Burkholderia stabilis TaxID=95485 RepID=UPI003C7E3AAF
MNKTYRVVWNASTGTWCAASEVARGRSKSASSTTRIAASTVIIAASVGSAYAAPSDALEDTADTSEISSNEIKRADVGVARLATDTRAIVSDNSAYIKISGNDNGTDNASALGEKSIAIGSNASTRPSSVTALGGAVAVGSAATAAANNVAVGASASALGAEGAVALGAGTNAAGTSSVAIGNSSQATGWGAFAMGRKAQASAESGLALGDSTVASQIGATAVGLEAKATAENAIAIGTGAIAGAENSVVLGSYSDTDRAQVVSVGAAGYERQVVNVARGTQATDAVNIEQLKDVTSALGGSAGVAADGTITKPSYKVGDKVYNDVGSALQAASQTGGAGNAVQYDGVSKDTVTLGGTGTGAGTTAVKLTNVRAGTLAAASTDAVNGAQLFATNNRVTTVEQALTGSGLVDPETGASLAVTYDSAQKDKVTLNSGGSAAALTNVKAARLTATSTDAVNGAQLFTTNKNVGDLQQALKEGGVFDPSTGASLAVVYDGAQKGSVTLAGTGGTTLTNVKAGKVTASSSDAVNGGQLYGVSSSVAAALGGGSAVKADGTVSKPSYTVGDETYTNVGDAIQAAAATGGAGGADPNAVRYDGAGKTSVTLGGASAAPVALKNVAAGVANTDAVNVKQLATGLSDVKNDIETSLGDGSLDMKYIKVKATGTQAVALGANAVAIGSNANASNVGSLAIGTGARASGMNSVAVGVNSVATKANTVSVGSAGNERKIVNVAEGTVDADSTDAINGSQLYAALNSLSSTLDEKTQAFEGGPARMRMLDSEARSILTRDVNAPLVAVEGQAGDNIASLNGGDPTLATAAAIGVLSAASGSDAIAVGLQTVAGSDNSVAIGSLAQTGAGQDYAVAMGSDSQTNGTQAIAIGAHVQANADNALAVGNNNTWALSQSSVAVGDGARVNAGATSGIAMGKSASVSRNVTNGVALGANTSVTANGGVALGQGSVANRGNAVSIGGGMVGQRQIINVASGTQGTDAVNVNQLKGVTNSLGGGATIGADGSIVAPGYTIGGTTYDNVGDALNAAASQGGGSADGVNYDDATKAKVTLAGATGTKITKVAAGDVSAKSTDAINGAQLFATNESLGGLKESLKDGGVIDPTTGKSLAVVYDSATKDKVTLGGESGTTLSGVKAGVANTDAVNVSQLKDSGLIGTDGKSVAAVTYDDATKGKITLGGAKGTKITKVAAGDVSATSTDAINGAQLFATNESLGGLKESLKDGGVIDPTTGKSLAVVYDSATKDKVTLGGEGGATLSGVKAGVANTDAVNVSQLKDSGLIGTDGKSIAAVTYDDATKGKISLGGATGTKITKVAAGDVSAKSTDAINGSQLFATNESLGGLKESLKEGGVIDPTTGKSLAVVYDSAKKDKVTLGGEGGTTLSGVKAGVANTDAVNVSQLKDSGLIGTDGKSVAAVTYDRNKDGTPNYGSVTLGNGKGSTQIKHVADATEDG